ncbi:MAG: restriction endonuclease subunit S [Dehalococcoidia bacterium]|nr:restriction endonuclease subunit S [Dehalococcoidia bacterium]
MTSPVDIRPDQIEIVQSILCERLPHGVKVWVFGSRANWTTKDSSDLDLALQAKQKLDRKVVGALKDAFEDSELPYTVDVVDINQIGDSFRQIIESQRVPLTVTSGGWREITLGEFAPFTYGKSLPVRKRNASGQVPVFGSNGIVGYHDSALTDGPTIIIGRKGTAGAVQYSPIPCWPIDTTFFFTEKDIELIRFKYYTLSVLGLDDMNTDSAVPGLNRNAAHACVLNVPDDSEQRAIAHVLGTLDDKIELNRRMNQTLEEMARAIFKDWFVDFGPTRAEMEGREPYLPAEVWELFPDRLVPSELGEIPEGWGVKALGEVVELAYGKALRATDRKGGPIPVYGSNGQVGWHDQKLVAGPGIVVGRKGNPGIVTWAHGDFFPIDTTFYVVPKDDDGRMPFLFFALTDQDLPSISADSAVPGLNRNLAYMNRQLVPDKMIIDRFTDYANAIFSRCHRLEEESYTLAAQRDTLLPKLVSEEVRVADT